MAKLRADQRLVDRGVRDVVSGVPPLLQGRNPGVELQHGAVVVKLPEGDLLDGRDPLLVRGWDRGVHAHRLTVHHTRRDLGTLGHEVSDGGVCPGGVGRGRRFGRQGEEILDRVLDWSLLDLQTAQTMDHVVWNGLTTTEVAERGDSAADVLREEAIWNGRHTVLQKGEVVRVRGQVVDLVDRVEVSLLDSRGISRQLVGSQPHGC